MIKVTINDKNIEVPPNTTVLQAARMAGVEIPTLCDHKALSPYGGCRLCLVEVQGARTLQPSCTLPVSNNMVVKTESEKISAARKFVLTLLFSERNHFCPYCQVSGGDCELQNSALAEGMTHWPLPPNWQQYAVDASHPYFVLDHNRCILCRRCVRACAELSGNFTLGFEERGAKSFLIADYGTPLGQSSCISCGSCTQVCPTGAIIDRVSAYRGKVTQVEHNPTICVGCSVGCGIDVLTRDNSMVRIEGDWNAVVNGGVICKTGRFLPLSEERHRLTTPLVRSGDTLQPATWEDALAKVSAVIKPLSGKKSAGVAAVASTRLPAESLFAFKNLFADALQSDMATSTEEGQTTGLAANLAEQLGKPFEANLTAIQLADCIFNLGVNLVENHEVAGFFVKRILPTGVKLVVADTASNPLENLAQSVLKTKPGTDAELIAGLTAAIQKLGLSRQIVEAPESAIAAAAVKTGLAVDALMDAAQILGSAQRLTVVYGKGITAKENSAALKALLGFAQATNAALISMKGQANSQAAAQYRLDKPFGLNGHQAAFIALGDDQPSQRLIQKLENVPFLVVQASYASQLTAMADVVLPVTPWFEQDGHYLNVEGRLQEARKAVYAPEGIYTNLSALEALAAQLGVNLDPAWKENLSLRTPITTVIE